MNGCLCYKAKERTGASRKVRSTAAGDDEKVGGRKVRETRQARAEVIGTRLFPFRSSSHWSAINSALVLQ